MPPSPPNDPPRLVIVEDDTANRLFFTDYLTYAGYQVLALPHGLDLQRHLQAFQPHGLLLDLGLPEIDGYTLLSQLRSGPAGRQLPVIVVSGYAFVEDRQRALALGAQAYLTKPVSLPQLSQTVAAVLRHGPPKEQPSRELHFRSESSGERWPPAPPADAPSRPQY